MRIESTVPLAVGLGIFLAATTTAQPPLPGGPGGPPGGQERKIVAQFDKDGDGRLNREERAAAREFLKKEGGGRGGFGGRGPGGPGARGFSPVDLIVKPLLESLDADKDGKLSKEELLAGAKKLFAEIDKDGKGVIDETQLANAINRLLPMPQFPGGPGGFPGGPGGGFPGGPGGPGGFGPPGMGSREPGKPGPKVSVGDVKNYPDASAFDPNVLRTLFLEFENKDWEAELQEFYGTDVEVPATLTVDGKKYPNVGVHFRGMSSYMMIPAGSKRSLNLSIDFADPKQRLYGQKTLNLLNENGDASMLSTALYSHIAQQYIPAPKANVVKVVINGESWGVYATAQQFNKEFVAENFKSPKSARWKVRGSPGGDGGLAYVGEKIEDYKRRYTIKSEDKDKDWKSLIALCKTLTETPLDKLEDALKPIFDIEGALWFLALDVTLMNEDGYWVRASDYNICRDDKGVFHVVPHDMNEGFQPAMMMGGGGRGGPGGGGPGGRGPGGPGGPGMAGRGGNGFDLDPLVGLNDARKPLRSRLLAVPSLRKKYLEHVRAIAEDWLDWKKLGPIVANYRKLIEAEVEADTRKLESFAAFKRAIDDEPSEGGRPNLRAFADQRRKFLLNHPEIKKLTDSRE